MVLSLLAPLILLFERSEMNCPPDVPTNVVELRCPGLVTFLGGRILIVLVLDVGIGKPDDDPFCLG